jgi:RimJ/RimL family protein N-acetyltransferase
MNQIDFLHFKRHTFDSLGAVDRLGAHLELRVLRPEDVSPVYVEWLNDPDVNQYLESRFLTHTIDSTRAFVRECYDSDCDILLGVWLLGRHIGNAKLGPIAWNHQRADLGLMIGDKTVWGRGIGSAVVRSVTDFALTDLHFNKVTASAYATNIGSIKSFERCGYRVVGVLERHSYVDQETLVDVVLFERVGDQSGHGAWLKS